MSMYMASKKTMEINPFHPIVKSLREKADVDASEWLHNRCACSITSNVHRMAYALLSNTVIHNSDVDFDLFLLLHCSRSTYLPTYLSQATAP